MSDRSPRSPDDSWNEVRSLVDREGGGPQGWEEEIREFLELLRSKNEAINLVSRASIDRVVELQVLPSLAGLLVLPRDQSIRVLDIGSGGGFPGIPLRILRPKIRLDLVEATQKKARFLNECVRKLGFHETAVHACRIESPNSELLERAPFDVAFARAVGQEEVLARSTKRILRMGHFLWVFSGEHDMGEEYLPWNGMDGSTITGLRRLAIGEYVGTEANLSPGDP